MPLSADDVGHRVVVRHEVGRREGRPVFTDVLGVLVSYGADGVSVRRSDGRIVAVPAGRVAAGKRVPPKPVRRSVLALEEAADDAWPAPDTAWIGRWKLRAAGGWTGRANSVLPLGAPDRSVDEALTAVTEWYGERRLPARIAVTTEDPLDEELGRRGWSARLDSAVLVQTAQISSALEAAAEAEAALVDVRIDEELREEWLSCYRPGSALPAAARSVLTGPRGVLFASIPGAAIGRGVVSGQWLGLSCVEVLPESRRSGYARAIVAPLLAAGAQRGARIAWLQVGGDNTGGVALYASLGFATHHRYRYRFAP